MKNLGGLLVVLVGAFFVIVGLKGTQTIVFPSLFPATGGVTSGNQPTTGAGGGPGGLPPNIPIYQN